MTQTPTIGEAFQAESIQSVVGTATMVDAQPVETVAVSGKTRMASDKDYDLAKALSRPIRAFDFTWAEDASFDAQILNVDLLSLWLADPYVSSRLKYYDGVRGTVCAKVVHNGNVYTYGQLVLFIEQDPGTNPEYRYQSTYTAEAYGGGVQGQEIRSAGECVQLPLHCLVNPAYPTDTVFRVPMINLDSYYRKDFGDRGVPVRMGGRVLAPTARVDTLTPTSISFQIYVWMEDAEAVVPVGTEMEVTPGYIRGKAVDAVVALTKSAARLALGTVAQEAAMIAKDLGFSKPSDPVVQRTVLEAAGDMCHVDGSDQSARLTSYIGQGVPVDAASLGFGADDDTLFTKIASRPGLLERHVWTVSQNPNDQITMRPVNPVLSQFEGTYDVYNRVQPMPMAFAAMPFAYWRGDLRFEVDVIASPFHRGTLMLVYSPDGLAPTASTLANNMTRFITKVVEISGPTRVSMDIPWMRRYPVLETRLITRSGDSTYFPKSDNGLFYVIVLNKLSNTLGSGGGVVVALYGSCPNLRVFAPRPERVTENVAMLTELLTESGLEYDDVTYKMVAGEEVTNFNTLSRMFIRDLSIGGRNTSPGSFAEFYNNTFVLNMRPLARFNISSNWNASYETLGTDPPYVLPSGFVVGLQEFISLGFMAARGGVRFKVALEPSGRTVGDGDTYLANFQMRPKTAWAYLTNAEGGYASLITEQDFTDDAYDGRDLGTNATAFQSVEQRGMLEFEVPYQFKTRFLPARSLPVVGGLYPTTVNATNARRVGIIIKGESNTLKSGTVPPEDIEVYHKCALFLATADDHTYNYFYKAPILYINA